MTEELKRCPFCGEQILAIAKKCKHCSSDLEHGSTSGSELPKPATDYGIILVAIPCIATLFIWFWVSGLNILQSPASSLSLILLATVTGTASVAAIEASKIGMRTDRAKGTYSPTAWFFIISMIWFVGYPAYLLKRKNYGLSSRLITGSLAAVVFLVSWGLMSVAIEAKKEELREKFGHERTAPKSVVPEDVTDSNVSPIASSQVPPQATIPVNLCRPDQQVVFSCRTQEYTIALCASKDVSSSLANMKFRARSNNGTEIAIPDGDNVHPKEFSTADNIVFSGGGASFIRLKSLSLGDKTAVIYSGIGRGWEKEGLAIQLGDQTISNEPCIDESVGSFGPNFFSEAGIPIDTVGFDIPE